jgi:hypothetical protein
VQVVTCFGFATRTISREVASHVCGRGLGTLRFTLAHVHSSWTGSSESSSVSKPCAKKSDSDFILALSRKNLNTVLMLDIFLVLVLRVVKC